MSAPAPALGTPSPELRSLADAIAAAGHAFVPAARMRPVLEAAGALSDWPAFAASWDALPHDEYMADHGRYRRRRHAAYAVASNGAIARLPPRPHFQALDYNPLNGGIERWFAPVEDACGSGPSMLAILRFCNRLSSFLSPEVRDWLVEVHQFRIEAGPGMTGQPTPEGMHRDGVDHVLVLLVARCNIASGTTLIGNDRDGFFSSFTLSDPFDAALVDDRRVFHGVTPVEALDPGRPAHRDVLVVTFRREPPGTPNAR